MMGESGVALGRTGYEAGWETREWWAKEMGEYGCHRTKRITAWLGDVNSREGWGGRRNRTLATARIAFARSTHSEHS